MFFVRLAKTFHRKVVLHVHGGGFKEYYRTSPVAISKFLNLCDVIAVLSEQWKTFFQGITSSEVEIVHNVIEPVADEDVSYGKAEKHLVTFLFLGMLAEPKGIFDLVSTIGENQEIFRGKAIFEIGGNGDSSHLGEMISGYGISDIVRYRGWVSGEEKKKLLKKSDVYVLPSYAEGVPISILEAMAYGMAIVATPVGGIPEIVKALRLLLSDEDKRRKMGAISYEEAQSYLPGNVERELLTMYEKLLKNEGVD